MRSIFRILLTCIILFSALEAGAAEKLVVDFMISSGQQRAVWVDIINRFAQQNPDIRVVHREFSPDAYGRDTEGRLEREKVDVAYGFAGERLSRLVEKKLVAPFDPQFVDAGIKNRFSTASLEATALGGRVYGLPIAYYQWGFWYRKSLFRKLGIKPPKTWNDLLQAADVLKAANVTPSVIGTKDAMAAAAWFDYLDLRINGIVFHRKLLRGEAKFTDPRVRLVFDEWKKLLDSNFFLPETVAMTWENTLPYLYRRKVGMILMGGFIATKFPAKPVSDIADDIGFFPFPRYSANMAIFEEAPLDLLVLPANGENRVSAYRFLEYLIQSDALVRLNDAGHTISPRKSGQGSGDPNVASAMQLLESAEAIAFFFDRDAKAYIVPPAFDGFKKFLAPPFDAEAAIRHIDKNARPSRP